VISVADIEREVSYQQAIEVIDRLAALYIGHKQAKDYDKSDYIRREMCALGFEVSDKNKITDKAYLERVLGAEIVNRPTRPETKYVEVVYYKVVDGRPVYFAKNYWYE